MASSLRKQQLLAEKVRLSEVIQNCDETLQELKNKPNYVAYESDSSDEGLMDRRPTKVFFTRPPSSYELLQKCEKLEARRLATQELTGVYIESSDIERLLRPPEDLNITDDELECYWHSYSAKCRLGLVPFNITFLLQTPTDIKTKPLYRRRFHRVRLSLTKRQHALEWSRARAQYTTPPVDDSQHTSPVAEILALRAYVDCVRSRRETLLQICEQYQEKGHITLEPSEGGGHKITGPDSLFELEWEITCEKGCNNKFINHFELLMNKIGEEFEREVQKLFVKLCHEKNTSGARVTLLTQLVDMCLSVDTDAANEPSDASILSASTVASERNAEDYLDSNIKKAVAAQDVQQRGQKGKKGKRQNRNARGNSQDTVKL